MAEPVGKTNRRGRPGIDLRAALAAHDDEQRAVAHDLTFEEAVNSYVALHFRDGGHQLKKWVDLFGDRSVWSIEPEEIARALDACIRAGMAPSTANRNASAVGSVYRWLIRERRCAPRGFSSPTRNLPRFEEPLRRVELSQAEVDRIMAGALAFRDRRFGVLVRLLGETGGRRGEVLERRWADFDLDARTIHVPRTKTGIPRVLRFSEDTAALIRRVWKESERSRPDALPFESKRAPGTFKDFKLSWRQLTQAVGRPDLHLHDLRHFRAAQMLRAGVPLATAAQALGHSSLILNRRYGHLATQDMHSAIERSWG